MKLKIVAIIQARMGSSRFPGKMSAILNGYTIIEWVIRRVKESELIQNIVLATSTKKENDYLERIAHSFEIKIFRGDEENVLSRFVKIAEIYKPNIIIRICADNPFITASEIDRIIKVFIKRKPDYAFNHVPKLGNNYVDGLGVEVFSKQLLDKIALKASAKKYLEHVTLYIWDHPVNFTIETIKAPSEFSYPNISLDVDTEERFIYLQKHLAKVHDSKIAPEHFNVRKIITSMREST